MGDYVDPTMALAAARMVCCAMFIAWLLILDDHIDLTTLKRRRKKRGPWDRR